MKTLYHLWLHPASRKIRLLLAEKELTFSLKIEKIWERRTEFLMMNPAGDVPVLVEENGTAITGHYPIAEYIDEKYQENNLSLLGDEALNRAEVRRLIYWFDQKFNEEVTNNLLGEKVMKRFFKTGQPHASFIRAGNSNIHYHLDYIGFLTEQRNWLAGDLFSLADITAAAHLSCLDYIGDVPWDDHHSAKTWYARIKSRPSFKPILDELVPGIPPQGDYSNVDF